MHNFKNGRFQTGRIVMTTGALAEIREEARLSALLRHMNCDWGELCEEDWKRNDQALVHGLRLFSAYRTEDGTKFWIITEADRSATTILLPEEY